MNNFESLPDGLVGTRHSIRADGKMGYGELPEGDTPSEDYPALTKEGVELIRDRTVIDFVTALENAPERTVLFIGGSSEADRVRQTATIIGDTLKEKYCEDEAVQVITQADLPGGLHQIFTKVHEEMNAHPNSKLVVCYPLFLKELSLQPHHRERKTNHHTPYMLELLAQTNRDEVAAATAWFQKEGSIERADGTVLEVPPPQATAETHLKGLQRLAALAQEVINEDRPLIIGFAGHGWQLDALAVYLAKNGTVTADGYNEIFEGKPLEQGEALRLIKNDEGYTLTFRQKEYPFPTKSIELQEEF